MTARPGQDRVPVDVMDSLVQASFTVIALLSQVAAEHDLSLTQLRVLAILRDRQPRMTELATHLGLERSSVSGLIDRAAGRGLVRREVSSDDGRAVRVSLTPAGQRLASLLSRGNQWPAHPDDPRSQPGRAETPQCPADQGACMTRQVWCRIRPRSPCCEAWPAGGFACWP